VINGKPKGTQASTPIGQVEDTPLHPGRRVGAAVALTHFIAVLYSHLLVLFALPRPSWLPGTDTLFFMLFFYFAPFAFWHNAVLHRAGEDADLDVPGWGMLAIKLVQGYAIVVFFFLMASAFNGRIEQRPDGYYRVNKGDAPAVAVTAEEYRRFKAREGAVFSAWPMAFALPMFIMIAFGKYPPPKPDVRTYRWRCLVCDQGNDPAAECCEQCGCPSDAKANEIDRRAAERS